MSFLIIFDEKNPEASINEYHNYNFVQKHWGRWEMNKKYDAKVIPKNKMSI